MLWHTLHKLVSILVVSGQAITKEAGYTANMTNHELHPELVRAGGFDPLLHGETQYVEPQHPASGHTITIVNLEGEYRKGEEERGINRTVGRLPKIGVRRIRPTTAYSSADYTVPALLQRPEVGLPHTKPTILYRENNAWVPQRKQQAVPEQKDAIILPYAPAQETRIPDISVTATPLPQRTDHPAVFEHL